jgi:membrane protein DedA with SNARE-associated domain
MVEQWIHDWGYLAVAVGAFAEGETVLLAAGYAARRGLLDIGLVLAIAVVAASAGDQCFYWIGRCWGRRLLQRWPRLAAQFERVATLLRRRPRGAIVAVRFLYGLRIAGPILIGAAGVPAWRFALFNVLGALLWASLIAGAGWGFGQAMGMLELRLEHVELGLIALLGLLASAWALARRRARRRR